MRFALRSFLGLLLILAGLGAAGFGVMRFQESRESASGFSYGGGGPRERIFAVETGVVTPDVIRPEIVAYGEIRSWRTLQIRAAVGGVVVQVSEAMRDGAAVKKGDLLFRIDPEDFLARRDDAEAALAEAEADLAEAREAVGVAEREMAAAESQLTLRRTALERQRGLLNRGVATAQQVEDAELSAAAAEQTAAGRAQALLAARIKIDRNQLRVQRAQITLDEARRQLAKTSHYAPFDGLLSNVSIALGALAQPNEQMGELIDPRALEAAFQVTNAQFARLLDDKGALKPTPLTVTLDLDDAPLIAPGALDRADAVIDAGQTGRQLFARLDIDARTILRPGDFVTVRIVEPPLSDVARLPSAAVTEEGALLLVGEDERLSETTVRILRRLGDDVIVAGAPPGAVYVTERAPQLGKGVKVKLIGEAAEDAASEEETPDIVDLQPEQAKRLLTLVEGNNRMPAQAKARIINLLKENKAPRRFLERMGQRG